jgi:hypothetical protein
MSIKCAMTVALALFFNLVTTLPARAAEPIFHTRSYNAFTQIFGRPEFFAGSMRDGGSSEARVTLNLVSFAEIDTSGTDGAELDGETYHALFSFSHNVTDRWEVAAQLPFLYHSGGFMDSTVDNFHDLFGLPEGDRPNQGQNQLLFATRETGQTPFRLDSSTGGIGDVRLNSRYLLTAPGANARQFAVHAGLKLATGDADDLLGSGATDYSAGLGYSDPVTLGGLRTTLSAHAGILVLGDGDVLSDQQEDTVGFGGLQLTFAATRRVDLIAQIQGASAYYDSNLDVLGSSTVQLAFGANVNFPDSGWDWRFGIIEDGLSDVMPDFALHMEISRQFGRR